MDLRQASAALASLYIESRLLREAVITPPHLRARLEAVIDNEILRTLTQLSM